MNKNTENGLLRVLFQWVACFSLPWWGSADPGQLVISRDADEMVLQVLGNENQDWVVESSEDALNWSHPVPLGTVLAGSRDEAPHLLIGSADESNRFRFFRAWQSEGLYDTKLLREFYLTFEADNWQDLLTQGREDGSNTAAILELDNGARIEEVGARYRGNTSFNLGGLKKSINLEIDYSVPDADLMRFDTLNLNNAATDYTIMREPIYFSVMSEFAVCPRGAQAQVYINGENWGVYSLAQQQDGDLIRAWFPSNDGDRWRAPNRGGTIDTSTTGAGPGGGRPRGGGPGGGPGGGGPGGGGGFSSDLSALSYQGPDVSDYASYYELDRSADPTVAWQRLAHAIDVLHNTPEDSFRERVEDVFAVDRWLWFLGIEIVFADDDSYWNKGADYMFYYEPESGRIHPIQHDGNESFVTNDVHLSPVEGADGNNRPMLYKLLGVPELRQRYLAHMRTFLNEGFHPDVMTPLIDGFHERSRGAIEADPKKNFSMQQHLQAVTDLKSFVTNRFRFLSEHPELAVGTPEIVSVSVPLGPIAGEPTTVSAVVNEGTGEGIDSVWLYYRAATFGRFERKEMFDDGAHGDGVQGDGVFGGTVPAYLAGLNVQYYVEVRSANEAKSAVFSPTRAEEHAFEYQVGPSTTPDRPSLVLNELMASNQSTNADPQGDYDDWIEIWNVTDDMIDLGGMYLSDKADNPRKWRIPDGTMIGAGEFVVIWADEEEDAEEGLHANFKLSAGGESLFLIDTDERLNALIDSVVFPALAGDVAYGRESAAAASWVELPATPGRENR